MSELPDPTTIPPVTEHIEAYQASVDANRREAIAAMNEAEKAKMAVLESVSKQLEDAQIPFALWGSPLDKENGVRFWRFNRLDYLPPEATFKERSDLMMRVQFWCLAPTMAQWTFAGAVKHAAYYGKEQELLYGYQVDDVEERIRIVIPEDKK